MGSALKFIQSAADPIGDIVAHVAGPNSIIAKDQPSWDKYINPEMTQLHAENQAQWQAPTGVLNAGAASGASPTLAAAAAGYKTPSFGVGVGGGQSGTFGAASGTSVFNPSTGGLNGLPYQNAAPGGTNYFGGTPSQPGNLAATTTPAAPIRQDASALQQQQQQVASPSAMFMAAPGAAAAATPQSYVQAAGRAQGQGNSNAWGY